MGWGTRKKKKTHYRDKEGSIRCKNYKEKRTSRIKKGRRTGEVLCSAGQKNSGFQWGKIAGHIIVKHDRSKGLCKSCMCL